MNLKIEETLTKKKNQRLKKQKKKKRLFVVLLGSGVQEVLTAKSLICTEGCIEVIPPLRVTLSPHQFIQQIFVLKRTVV